MSFTCFSMSCRTRCAAIFFSSSLRASRSAVTASSGNFASMHSGRWSGRNTTQSGRLLFDSVNWNS